MPIRSGVSIPLKTKTLSVKPVHANVDPYQV